MYPHRAIIKLNIEIHAVRPDGGLEHPLPEKKLEELGVGKTAVLSIDSVSLEDCIKEIFAKLEKING